MINDYRHMTQDELTFCDTCHGNMDECECEDQPDDYEIIYCPCGGVVYQRRYLELRCTRCSKLAP